MSHRFNYLQAIRDNPRLRDTDKGIGPYSYPRHTCERPPNPKGKRGSLLPSPLVCTGHTQSLVRRRNGKLGRGCRLCRVRVSEPLKALGSLRGWRARMPAILDQSSGRQYSWPPLFYIGSLSQSHFSLGLGFSRLYSLSRVFFFHPILSTTVINATF